MKNFNRYQQPIIQRRSWQIANLISHLNGRHRSEAVVQRYEAVAAAAAAATTEAKTKTRMSAKRQQKGKGNKIRKDKGKKIKGLTNQVFLLVDGGFHHLIAYLKPGYSLLSRCFSNASQPGLYDVVIAS